LPEERAFVSGLQKKEYCEQRSFDRIFGPSERRVAILIGGEAGVVTLQGSNKLASAETERWPFQFEAKTYRPLPCSFGGEFGLLFLEGGLDLCDSGLGALGFVSVLDSG
jgi:hypothetical protein